MILVLVAYGFDWRCVCWCLLLVVCLVGGALVCVYFLVVVISILFVFVVWFVGGTVRGLV